MFGRVVGVVVGLKGEGNSDTTEECTEEWTAFFLCLDPFLVLTPAEEGKYEEEEEEEEVVEEEVND